MKPLNLYLISLVLVAVFVFVSCKNSSSQKNTQLAIESFDNAIKVRIDTMMLEAHILEDGLLNFRYYPSNFTPEFFSYSRTKEEFPDTDFNWKTKGNTLYLSTSLIIAKVDLESGSIQIMDKEKNILFSEISQNAKLLVPRKSEDDHGYSSTHKFILGKNEAIYGFGQHQEGTMNYRGKTVELYQHNMKVSIPVMISSNGYGIFWDNYSFSKFEDLDTASFWSELGDGINFYFIYGPEPDGIISGIRKLTGKATMLPRWAFGLMQSRAKYEDQEEILEVVRRYRELKVPLDVIVQDWQYWPNGWWGFKSYDPLRFPDPAQMLDKIHNTYNCRYMISIWPCLEPGSEDYTQMADAGYLYEGMGERRYYNAFDPAARKLFWEQTNDGLFKYGVDAWWCDATEPEINGWDTSIDDYKKIMKNPMGSPCRFLNAYSLLQAKGIYEGQRSVTSEKRVINLTRSAFIGQQRYGAITWSGDVSANWEAFHNQISAGLNFSITGIPYWTADIGAFFVNDHDWFRSGIFPDGVKDPAYHEFFVRWYQFGAFCPVFRVHGAQTPREIWHFGKPGDWAFDIQLKYNNLRYRLLPYIYSISGKITHDDYTIMRPLVMDFREDRNVWDIDDQYMFGPSLLISPVTVANATSRNVYLPDNEGGWFDFWTGKKYSENQNVQAMSPIETIPVYVRAGSIIPMGPFLQYTSEKSSDTLEIRIYQGRDAMFTLYEDENDGYGYEQGKFTSINFTWNEHEKTLEISETLGANNNIEVSSRVFHIILVSEAFGTGLEITTNPLYRVPYEGKKISMEIQ